MKSRLLTFDDLYNFYSKYTKSKHFNCEEQGCEPIVVQTPATIKFAKSEIYEGLTAVRLQACHTERNLNSSSISKEVMENKLLPTFKNRPILGYIHEVDGEPQFYGHNMHLSDDGEEIIYDEIPVGIIPESNEAELKYNSDTEKYEVFVSGYIFGICDISIEKYFFYLEEEYKLLYRVKKPEDDLTFEEYFNMKAPYYALYEFFRQRNLVTERSYNE